MKRGARTVSVPETTPWISHDFAGGGTDFFDVKLCRTAELSNYPLIQTGADWMDVEEAPNHILEDILRAIPATIAEDDIYPKAGLGGTWQAPSDKKLDRVTADVIVSPVDYGEQSEIDWSLPHFVKAVAEFIDSEAEFTPIPESKTGMFKQGGESGGGGANGEWAIFMPNKASYGDDNYSFAIKHSIYEYSTFTWWGEMFYSGCDLNEETHILFNYDTSFPTSVDPNSTGPELPIGTCNETFAGYTISYWNPAGSFHARVLRKSGWYDADYYPGRDPGPEGGGGILIPFFATFLHSQFNLPFPGDKRRRPNI